MVFAKRQRSKHSPYIRSCSDCGKTFELGEVYFTKYNVNSKYRTKNLEHFCEGCYEKKFIDI